MTMKEFKAESKRLLDIVINSIYTHKDIFLRELISNSSDAIDKVYYKALKDENITFNRDDYYIGLEIHEDKRILKIIDTGIGMDQEDLEENLGTIAKSGSYKFKEENKLEEDYEIIGQFGVGFYSAFMVASEVEVLTRPYGSNKAFLWKSDGKTGYTIEEAKKDGFGTEISLKIKESTEDEDYDKYLNEYHIESIVKKYSDFISYPIKMEKETSEFNEETKEFETKRQVEVLNTMVPIWRRNRNELKKEDYNKFYRDNYYDMTDPISHIHMNMEGLLNYRALIYIPRKPEFNYYSKDYEKGLELYSNGVKIMDKCPDLIPDYFNFVKGVVDSEDLSLNISREILQRTRELALIGNKIEDKIKEELLRLQRDQREDYIEFFEAFGDQIKYGVYDNFGMNKDKLKDLLVFKSSRNDSYLSLKEYVDGMKEEQDYIYYASGESLARIKSMPQLETLKDKGMDVLYFTSHLDEFAIRLLEDYEGHKFMSISSYEFEENKEDLEEIKEENKDLFKSMESLLEGKIVEAKPSTNLKSRPVFLSSRGDISIDMEKTLKAMDQALEAEKVLEVNTDHRVFEILQEAFSEDEDRFKLYTKLLYNQALLMEGLDLEDPVEFANNIWKLI